MKPTDAKTIERIKAVYNELKNDELFSVYNKKELLERATFIVVNKELNKSLNEIANTLPYV